MTVKELIAILSGLNPEAVVFLGDDTDPRNDKLAWECEGASPEEDKVVLSHARNRRSHEYLR